MATDTWALIHAERTRIIEDLETLTDSQWQSPSLCAGWTVHQLSGHIAALATQTPPKFVRKFVASGFNFDKMIGKDVARNSSGGPAATLAVLKDHAGDRTSPPGPVDSWLGETVVHGADFRRPLGLTRAPLPAVSAQVGRFYAGSNVIIGAKKRITGLRLVADDTEFTTGDGPTVTGPMLSLVLAMTGRPDALRDLSGDGLQPLRERMN